jgi:hypothetical protein
MKGSKIKLILFCVLMISSSIVLGANQICSYNGPIYADRDLANVAIQLPEKNSKNIHIKIFTPSYWFIGTDFPVVEGTEFLDVTTITNQEGVYNFQIVFPIRGTYKMEITDLSSNQTYLCNLVIYEHPSEIKNFIILLSILFIVGFISGVFIFLTNEKKSYLDQMNSQQNLQGVEP